jgi:hypothetical protein
VVRGRALLASLRRKPCRRDCDKLSTAVSFTCSYRFFSCTRWLCLLLVLSGSTQAWASQAEDAGRLFDRGLTWEDFLAEAKAQRDVWLQTTSSARVPLDMVERFRRVSRGLRILVVAEDWCPDSVNAVPYIAGLASSASVPLRIVDRKLGEPLMNRHRTPDGRTATPTVVLLRDADDVGAWVERPGVVQQWFLSMATNAENAKRFGRRQSWYESDRGHTVIAEVTALAERTAARK